MNVTSKTPVRRFRCPRCKTVFHIQRNNNGHYVRYMPPKYCPSCGEPTTRGEGYTYAAGEITAINKRN